MKKIFLFISVLFWANAFSQTATISGQFDREDVNRRLILSRPLQRTLLPIGSDEELIKVNKGKYVITITLPQPEIMYLASYINDTIEFKQPLFLKENYSINIDCKQKDNSIRLKITGKGAKDNQPFALTENVNFDHYPKDTVPSRIIADLQAVLNKNLAAFENYKATNKPSGDFVATWTAELKYTPHRIYYTYAKQRRLSAVRDACKRNKKQWDDAFDQLLIKAPLMNANAFSSYSYRTFIKMFLIFNKPDMLDTEASKESFIKEYYTNGTDTGSRSFSIDQLNFPNQKTIERYFSGTVKEYLYAHLFTMALERGTVTNLDSVYADFSKAYPMSPYKKMYDDPIKAVTNNRVRERNDKIVFEQGDIKTWNEVLNKFKGRTVLLDMWGTWCGPCRDEIKNNGATIKAYFKDKDLDYLYIANNDEANRKTWKSLITYFNMEGHHILANKNLTTDIVSSIQPEGGLFYYPTYVIIHKNGSFEASKARMSADKERKVLITEIESALKEEYHVN